jgi:hypothetical protein
MLRTKRYIIPALAASIVLTGVACAQPATATTSRQVVSRASQDDCPSGEAYWFADDLSGAQVLAGCSNGEKLSLRNLLGSEEEGAERSQEFNAAAVIVRALNPNPKEPLSYAVTSPSLPADSAQEAADEAVTNSLNGTSSSPQEGIFLPGQTLTITLPSSYGETWSTGNSLPTLLFAHDRIAAAATGAMAAVGEAFPEALAKAVAKAGGASEGVALYDCANGIREVYKNGKESQSSLATVVSPQAGTPAEQPGQNWIDFAKNQAYEVMQAIKHGSVHQACQEVWDAIANPDKDEPKEPATWLSFLKDLGEGLFDGLNDIASEHLKDSVPHP